MTRRHAAAEQGNFLSADAQKFSSLVSGRTLRVTARNFCLPALPTSLFCGPASPKESTLSGHSAPAQERAIRFDVTRFSGKCETLCQGIL
jgi:hypothetical protein